MSSAGPAPHETLLRGGLVVTSCDPGQQPAEAILLRDGIIAAVGDERSVGELAGPNVKTLDLMGGTVVPGLTDGHVHPGWVAEFAQGCDCSGCDTPEALATTLRGERAAQSAAVVRAFGLDRRLCEGEGLRGSSLERLAGGPALVTFTDCHTYLATASVLAAAGIDGELTWPDGGRIVVDEEGRPTGEVREFSAYDHVTAGMPSPAPAERGRRLLEVLARMASVGLTGAHVMNGAPEDYELLSDLEERAPLPMRMVVPLWVRPDDTDDRIDELLALADAGGNTWRGGAAKFFLDGILETGTAWLEEPDSEGEGCHPTWQVERFSEVVARFARRGFQCITHAIGDRAIRETFDTYEAVPAPSRGRHRIEHNEALSDSLLPRFAAHDVVCSMQPLHMQWREADGSDSWAMRLGPARAANAWRVADALRHDALVVLGSDWPVAQVDPRIGMAWARLRRRPGDRGGHVFEPSQQLDGWEALHGYTAAPAVATGDGACGGSLEPGRFGDLTVFAANPAEVDADDLPTLAVHLTMVAGHVTHDDGSIG